MPPRRTTGRRVANRAPRRTRKGKRAPLLALAVIALALLAGTAFYFLNQERDKHESIAAQAHKIAKENPDAEVFTEDVNPDADVKKK
jgi:uncharacterized protein HemX